MSERISVPVLKSTLPFVSNTKNLSVSVPALTIEVSIKLDDVIPRGTFNLVLLKVRTPALADIVTKVFVATSLI